MTKEKTVDMISKEGKRALSGLLQNPRFSDARSKRYIRCVMGEFDILPTLDKDKKDAIDSVVKIYSNAIVDPTDENVKKVKNRKEKEKKKVVVEQPKQDTVEIPKSKSSLDLTNRVDEIENGNWLNNGKEQLKPKKKRNKK